MEMSDLIDRQEAIDALGDAHFKNYGNAIMVIQALPSAEYEEKNMIQIDMDMPKSCAYCPCGDVQDGWCYVHNEVLERTGNGYPSTETRPEWCPLKEVKHGNWIHSGCGIFTCSKCGKDVGLNVYTGKKASERFKFCPHCGARMDEE